MGLWKGENGNKVLCINFYRIPEVEMVLNGLGRDSEGSTQVFLCLVP